MAREAKKPQLNIIDPSSLGGGSWYFGGESGFSTSKVMVEISETSRLTSLVPASVKDTLSKTLTSMLRKVAGLSSTGIVRLTNK